jgi:hypothetical protein
MEAAGERARARAARLERIALVLHVVAVHDMIERLGHVARAVDAQAVPGQEVGVVLAGRERVVSPLAGIDVVRRLDDHGLVGVRDLDVAEVVVELIELVADPVKALKQTANDSHS